MKAFGDFFFFCGVEEVDLERVRARGDEGDGGGLGDGEGVAGGDKGA